MKATVNIPDDLYRRVKAKSALEGRRIREVTIELYSRWLEGGPSSGGQTADQWLADWLRLADESLQDAPSGPTARTLLEEARGRIEPD
ncbi:MAG: hypothetical protein ACYC5Q_13720 [Thermoleophilia bacterium]